MRAFNVLLIGFLLFVQCTSYDEDVFDFPRVSEISYQSEPTSSFDSVMVTFSGKLAKGSPALESVTVYWINSFIPAENENRIINPLGFPSNKEGTVIDSDQFRVQFMASRIFLSYSVLLASGEKQAFSPIYSPHSSGDSLIILRPLPIVKIKI